MDTLIIPKGKYLILSLTELIDYLSDCEFTADYLGYTELLNEIKETSKAVIDPKRSKYKIKTRYYEWRVIGEDIDYKFANKYYLTFLDYKVCEKFFILESNHRSSNFPSFNNYIEISSDSPIVIYVNYETKVIDILNYTDTNN